MGANLARRRKSSQLRAEDRMSFLIMEMDEERISNFYGAGKKTRMYVSGSQSTVSFWFPLSTLRTKFGKIFLYKLGIYMLTTICCMLSLNVTHDRKPTISCVTFCPLVVIHITHKLCTAYIHTSTSARTSRESTGNTTLKALT